MKLRILKCHGSGNDFFLIDETAHPMSHVSEKKRSELVQTLCRKQSWDAVRKNGSVRETDTHSDGILFYGASTIADCKMRIFNADGSEAEMCGNGLRCIGRYAGRRLKCSAVTVETMNAVLSATRVSPLFKGVETFEAQIGPVSLAPDSLPMSVASDSFNNTVIGALAPDLTFTALSVPNPHIVTIVDDIREDAVEKIGLRANRLPLFPKGVNVSFAKPLGPDRLFVITCERGVGITHSCGTGMSASAYVSVLNGLSDAAKPIFVYNTGGMVMCDVSGPAGNILLKGNATFVFDAEVELDSSCTSIAAMSPPDVRTDDIAAYTAFQQHTKSLITA